MYCHFWFTFDFDLLTPNFRMIYINAYIQLYNTWIDTQFNADFLKSLPKVMVLWVILYWFSGHQPPLWSHLVVWQHCHLSLSVSRCLRSCEHLDSSCACVRASLRGRLLCHCWAVWRDWSATCAEYFRAVWVQESSANDPAAAWHCPKVLLHYWRLRACLQRKRERDMVFICLPGPSQCFSVLLSSQIKCLNDI